MFETIKKQVQRARKHFLVVLIKPTKYDDQGYVMRFLQGVLPSNSLMTLLGLTEDAIHRNILGEDVEIEVETYDETVHKIDPVRIMNRARKRGILRVVACFVGVQTNQFPRAVDLARTFKAEGAGVAIGGFHTSGLLAFFPNEPDLLALEEEGITIVKGEAEGHWDEFLLDAWKGRLKPFYDFSLSPVKLEGQPTPAVDADYLSRFAVKGFSTIDAGRGCIWRCKFCCVINVHGNEMRGRHPDDLVQFVRGAVKNGVRFCFIVDDNFVRNPYWREILEGLIKLKKEEGIHLEFMIQIDLVALRMKDFPELLAEAGCTQVFQGMESVNPDTLKSAGKPQNHVQEYNKTMAALRKLGILSHVGYMIGFPNETPESIARDIQILMNEVQPDIASFFIVTPIPGSEDHFVARQRGTVLSADYNDFDSFHQVGPHAGFPEASLEQVYRQAWATFYSYDNMKAILQRSSPKTYWNIFRNFIWYKHSYSVEDTHPMIAGFFRLKGRKSRRPIFKTEPMVVYYPRRALEISYDMWQRVKFLREMRRLWLETRSPTELEKKLTSHIETFRQEIAEHLHTVQGGLTYSQSHCQAFLEKGQGWLDLLKAMEAEWGQRSLQFPGKFLKGLRLKTEQAMETLHSVEATLRQGVGTPRLEERYRQALTSLAKKYEEALHYASNIKRQNSIVETFQFIRLLLKTREKEVVY